MSAGARGASGAVPEERVVSERELSDLGEALGRRLAAGAVVFLQGELGAGKTTLARAIVRGLGAPDAVSSPTYALVHHYHGRRGDVYHVDCYRLQGPDAAADLDWEQLGSSDALIVEWPERGGAWVPEPSVRVTLRQLDEDASRRRVVVQ